MFMVREFVNQREGKEKEIKKTYIKISHHHAPFHHRHGDKGILAMENHNLTSSLPTIEFNHSASTSKGFSNGDGA
jgi:hypothetical protein